MSIRMDCFFCDKKIIDCFECSTCKESYCSDCRSKILQTCMNCKKEVCTEYCCYKCIHCTKYICEICRYGYEEGDEGVTCKDCHVKK